MRIAVRARLESASRPWKRVRVSFPSGRAVFVVAVVSLVGVVAAACDGENNGVDDVKGACEIRVTWKRLNTESCVTCISAAPSVSCECPEFKDFAGKCEPQGAARRNEPSCTVAIDECVNNCKTDCACVDACYARDPGCRRVTSARDGCVAEVCAPYCD